MKWLLANGAALAILAAATAQPLFVDVAERAGLTARTYFGGEKTKKYITETTGGGVAFIDYDNDGWEDIFLVNGSRLEGFGKSPAPTNKLYRNRRDGTFEDVTEKAGLAQSGWGQGVCAGDFDNDGYVDLFVTYWGHNVLYRNNGDGSFRDVTEAAGMKMAKARWGSGCAFLDYDRDGHLDLFVSNYVSFDQNTAPEPGTNPRCQFKGVAVACGPRGLPGESNLLFHSNGDGTFTDVSEKSGIDEIKGNYGLGVLTADFDNDGWPDIYVANDTNASLLFHNKHDGSFEEIGVLAGCAYDPNGKETSGMGVAAADYDGDGWLDIFKTNFSGEPSSLYHSAGRGMFLEAGLEAGVGRDQKWLGWGCGFLDYDNDGWPDLFVVNGHVYPEVDGANLGLSFRQPKILYRNLGGSRFQDVSPQAGAAVTNASAGRGAAFGDFNNDGCVDVLINNMNDTPALLQGNCGNENHWLEVKAVGKRSNRNGVGARVICVTGKRRQFDEIRSGGSYLSQNDLRVHFGLGRQSPVDIRIEWPSGLVDELRNVRSDQILTIVEGSNPAKPESH
jgi:hypothetical protein